MEENREHTGKVGKGNPPTHTQFKKGETGNPKGRPPKLPDLNILLAEVLGEEKDGKTAAQAILAALRAKAAKGDIRAAEVLLNRGYGLPKQHIDHTSKGNELTSLTFLSVDKLTDDQLEKYLNKDAGPDNEGI